MLIREEQDQAAVHALNVSAFGTAAEADLVDALRDRAQPVISLVAEDAETNARLSSRHSGHHQVSCRVQ